jgi:hypothetical protein
VRFPNDVLEFEAVIGNLLFFFGMLVVGIILLRFNWTKDPLEDEYVEDVWFRELINGPPGYYRVVGKLFGALLIIVSVLLIIWNLVHS